MAILRAELQGNRQLSRIYGALAETSEDLLTGQAAAFAPGSLVYCLDEKQLYAKTADGTWKEV